ncbi:class I poly(R)-hydroxyalkanoic acid synthase [Maribius pontilimi]|uniref:Class I poly(R)-hydroxyalkanoic acid synthase n=1 Tax=Palleronia pontilimi TaxID=1964209 RepID=A0A934IH50_9RHOB|nr:class I poly(R)-hydroxyalkanoic acid synthase [Palleronia pontilimi]MBJ3762746.1 class I poly(R)-hydroxyalkanoic acid synthase [Palleronia pontilimi]
MATKQTDTSENGTDITEKMAENLAKLEVLSKRLMNAMAQKRQVPANLQAPGSDLYMKAMGAWMTEAMTNPGKLFEHQVGYWSKTMKHYIEAQQKMMQGDFSPPEDPTGSDRRFSDDMWSEHPFFNYLKQQYLMNSEAISQAVDDLEGLEPADRKRLRYFSEQITNMMSPTNFLSTNPEALAKALETEGQSLVDGLENLVRDLEANDGQLIVTLADKDAFKVGGNLATSPGKVVFRNRMFELIQYSPSTEQVHKTPLLIFPPWINKFYILDLKEKNSMVKWIVDQGFTLFMVSWVNPDTSYEDVGLGDYIEDGFLAAIEQVQSITGEDKLNAVGYCIAGTTLALTLSLMEKRGQKPINSATFFTTLTDFSDRGEVGVFLEDDFVDGIEAEVKEHGMLDSFYMSRTFSFLRSNDLIYQPAIKSYMLGEAPPAFDLLYWNGDSTNLPAKMAVQYLRELCQGDAFATTGIELLGETLHIKDVKVPLMAVACETDHIANWKSSFRGMQKMGGRSKTFILSESGHIAGIVNPPSKKKYGHYTGGDWKGTPEDWHEAAAFYDGSWWDRWGEWLAKKSGKKVAARAPGTDGQEVLCDAPGTYVISRN